ncbi:Crp/Fnr family transcriptional regulator [Mucilaginibacter sp.]
MDTNTLELYIDKVLDLPAEDKNLLISSAQMQFFKKGDIVLKEGEVCKVFYLVNKGYLRSYYNKDDVQINLNFTFEGNFTANLNSYRSRQSSEFNIEAAEDAEVWIINFRSLSPKLVDHPELGRYFRRLAINLLLASEEHSKLFKIYTPTERYRFIEQNSPRLLQRVPLSQLASYLGVTRETLSRIRAKNV